MRRDVLIFALSAALGAPPRATAQSVAERIAEMLSGVESFPAPAAWRALGALGEAALLAIARDPDALGIRRVRALRALGAFPSPAVRSLLRAVLGDHARPDMMRMAAVASLAAAFGRDAACEIEAFRDDADPAVRAEVARALASIGQQRGEQRRASLAPGSRLESRPANQGAMPCETSPPR